ncbi:MAG: hypothetical protein HY290_08720 [Planctomycetia bacterium]|nr:hypothetical protein [Planctomycetia bacterium]
MDQILRGYHLDDPTWFYLSFLLILAVFFKFSRFWSIRNLDLALLLSISPGLLLVKMGYEDIGYPWLFIATPLLLIRALSDGLITRRPRLEQNMNAAGMAFLCAATFLFLTTKLLKDAVPFSSVQSIRSGTELIAGEQKAPTESVGTPASTPDQAPAPTAKPGPGTPLVAAGMAQISKAVTKQNAADSPSSIERMTARLIAILAHLAIIFGLVLIGRHIFGDSEVGFAMATLYMLLPCTAYDVAEINNVLPAAVVVWAIWAYRRPVVTGMLLGLASAMMFFPVFLLPLWTSFYGKRGGVRFGLAVVLTTTCILSSLLLLSSDSQVLARQLLGYVPLDELWNRARGSTPVDSAVSFHDFWRRHDPAYIIPVFVTYLVMLVALTVWPRRKSLAHVIPHSAALVIGTQLWFPRQGGVYLLWYLPLLLLVVFRPQMTNHFAPEFKPFTLFRRAPKQAEPQPELAAAASGPSFGSDRP